MLRKEQSSLKRQTTVANQAKDRRLELKRKPQQWCISDARYERSFLDPEYSFDEYFQLGSRTNSRPIKNGLKGSTKEKDDFNLFTAPACQISRLNDARTRLQTVYFSVLVTSILSAMSFDGDPVTCQGEKEDKKA